MNYQKHYDLLMSRARARIRPDGYVEKHHVVPKYLGGSDEPSNLVILTAREHYVAHLLWACISNHNKAWFAVKQMGAARFRTNSHLYKLAREVHSAQMSKLFKGRVVSESTKEAMRGENNPMFGKVKELNPFYGKSHSAESKRKISEKSKQKVGWKHSEETKLKIASAQVGDKNHMYGKIVSEETRIKISQQTKGENNPMYGRRGESAPAFGRSGEKHPLYGKNHSSETKRKIGEASKKYWERKRNENVE